MKNKKPLGVRNGLKIYSRLKAKRINKISKDKQEQIKQERILKHKLLIRSHGKCEICGKYPNEFPFTLDKHEKRFRSKGGNPLDPDNCILICRSCHNSEHHIKEA